MLLICLRELLDVDMVWLLVKMFLVVLCLSWVLFFLMLDWVCVIVFVLLLVWRENKMLCVWWLLLWNWVVENLGLFLILWKKLGGWFLLWFLVWLLGCILVFELFEKNEIDIGVVIMFLLCWLLLRLMLLCLLWLGCFLVFVGLVCCFRVLNIIFLWNFFRWYLVLMC